MRTNKTGRLLRKYLQLFLIYRPLQASKFDPPRSNDEQGLFCELINFKGGHKRCAEMCNVRENDRTNFIGFAWWRRRVNAILEKRYEWILSRIKEDGNIQV